MNGRICRDESEDAFARSLHYLKYRPRSRREVIEYLEKKGFSETAVFEAISRLEQYRYINDEEFARIWIDNRTRNRPRGEFALRRELKQKGVSEDIIERMLSGFHEAEPAWRAVLPRLEQWAGIEWLGLKKKVYDHLRRRGFAYATCEEVYKRAAEYLGK
ncbi:MAG: RecX family transcriptional regulator [Desulfobacteraceae bacterium]|nr:RecX family transcriptional regulator [Desulfobacteraceae bacterium]